jgi:hypothetical protein
VAIVVKTDALPQNAATQIIEIIDDGIDPFGDRTTNITSYDSEGPRWAGPVAAVVLVALIGWGVATTATSSGAPEVAPTPSTSVVPTTTPTTTPPASASTIRVSLVPFYAADPWPGYAVHYADVLDAQQLQPSHSSFQLWAGPDATATTGSWFSIESIRAGPQSIYATNAYRLDTDGQSLAISHLPGGQSVAQASIDNVMLVTITAVGWSDAGLARLATSFGPADAQRGNDVQLNNPSLVSGYQMISSVQPWLAVQGVPTEQIYYSTEGDSSGFSISVAPRPPPAKGRSTLNRQVALRFFLDHTTPFVVDGHEATAGSLVGQEDQSVATWVDGDHIVTLSGQMPVIQLVAVAHTVHQVSSSEWDAMQSEATRNSSRFDNYNQTVPVPVSFGTDANAKPWIIRVGLAKLPGLQQVNWQWTQSGFGSTAQATGQINTVVENGRTYVLADLPRAVAAVAQLQVTRSGLDPVLVPFNDTDPTFDRTFAAYAFSEPTPYTAQIIGADGAVLAAWPSP